MAISGMRSRMPMALVLAAMSTTAPTTRKPTIRMTRSRPWKRAHEARDEGLLGLRRDLGLGVAEERVDLRDDAVDLLRARRAQPDHADAR